MAWAVLARYAASVVKPAERPATYEDVVRAPAHQVAELIAGVLHLSPRPGKAHAVASSVLGEELGPPFRRGRGGPGGWILLDEPELHLGDDVLVPDLGGWRRERMPALTTELSYFTVAPDWVAKCCRRRRNAWIARRSCRSMHAPRFVISGSSIRSCACSR
jgi:hypothetical protein